MNKAFSNRFDGICDQIDQLDTKIRKLQNDFAEDRKPTTVIQREKYRRVMRSFNSMLLNVRKAYETNIDFNIT